jgi:decaprenylphospho-beta-D-erythro-pentofuranosid-2-ulose 2-reductase
MLDALGTPQNLLLLGGTSDIALAVAQRYLERGPLRIVLAARSSAARDQATSRLAELGATVEIVDFDARDTAGHRRVVEEACRSADIDVALVAFGVLGDEERAWQDHELAMELAEVNYVGAVSVGILLGERMRKQGHGVIVALSSVAGERVRRSNFVYGSTKAGMDGFYLGLGEALAQDGVRVLVVRPGFVRTKMTTGRDAVPLSVTPDEVADAIVDGIAKRRELVWVPAGLRVLMSGLRHFPRPLFRRLPL